MRTYSFYQADIPRIIQNNDADNIAWAMEQVNDALRYLTTRYFWNEESVQFYTIPEVQFYPLPAQLKKLVNVTVQVGNVLWQPQECTSRQFWDALNVIQFYQEFPYYYFIWGGQLGIWPTPTSGTDIVTINYKSRIVDLSMADVTSTTTGSTVAVTSGSTAVVASGPIFVNWMAQSVNQVVNLSEVTSLASATTVNYTVLGGTQNNFEKGTKIQFTGTGSYTGISTGTNYYAGNVTPTTFSIYTDENLTSIVSLTGSGTAPFTYLTSDVVNPAGSQTMFQVPFTSSNSTSGDNQWYPLASVASGTTAYLSMPYQGPTVSGAPFTIGQTPLLIEDYQDLPLYRMAYLYYTTRFPDETKAKLYLGLYEEGVKKLDDEFANKSANVVLTDQNQPMVNPNLYVPNITQK